MRIEGVTEELEQDFKSFLRKKKGYTKEDIKKIFSDKKDKSKHKIQEKEMFPEKKEENKLTQIFNIIKNYCEEKIAIIFYIAVIILILITAIYIIAQNNNYNERVQILEEIVSNQQRELIEYDSVISVQESAQMLQEDQINELQTELQDLRSTIQNISSDNNNVEVLRQEGIIADLRGSIQTQEERITELENADPIVQPYEIETNIDEVNEVDEETEPSIWWSITSPFRNFWNWLFG